MSGKPAQKHGNQSLNSSSASATSYACSRGTASSSSNRKRKRSASKVRSDDGPETNIAAATGQLPYNSNTPSNKMQSNAKTHRTKLPSHDAAVKTNTRTSESQPRSIGTGNYPYKTDYNDHFETPLRAYIDILPLMQTAIGEKKIEGQKNNSEFTIYDPYFCTGRAATLLKQTFMECNTTVNIQHKKRDFYKDIRKKKVPQHDILVTNPPYSGNHKERCLEFAVGQLKRYGRPFFLLMPNYVASKEYFRKIVLEEDIQNVFVVPAASQPYEYDHPEGTGHDTPPFQSVWFCGLRCGKRGNELDLKSIRDGFIKYHRSKCVGGDSSCIPRISASLEELIKKGCVSGEKRKNPRQRKKMRQLAMQRAHG